MVYADDHILMSPSVTVLPKLFSIVEEEVMDLEMSINLSKSSCIRFGRRYGDMIASVIAHDGRAIPRVKRIKYLGIVMQSSRLFNVCLKGLRNRLMPY